MVDMVDNKSYPVKIGLEIHGYLNTREKLFCKCKVDENGEDKPNVNVCPICCGYPGSKPMLPNEQAMMQLIKVALALSCKINSDKKLVWQRKHYSWPDLPKGFQSTISGVYSIPCAENGKFECIRITEAHLEEDPARWNPKTGGIDYNRSGYPLIEIVTEPDFHCAKDVVQWLRNLILVLSYIKAIRKNAGIKVDVNVSTYGDRAEIKNLNSIEKIRKAIEYEVQRQVENYEKGIEQKRETLTYDENKGKTIKMREKEDAGDYRFIPEPDLPVICLDEKKIKKIKSELPEMPNEKLDKLLNKFKIDKYNADILTKNLDLVDFFEALAKHVDAKGYISWVTVELLRILNYNRTTLEEVDIQPEHLAELIKAIDEGDVTELKAKQVMNEFVPKSFSIKGREDFVKISFKEVEKICKEVTEKNKKAVEDYRSGKKESLNFLVGQVMRLSNKRADFKTAKDCLMRVLG